MKNIELDRGQIWQEKVEDRMIVGIIVINNHDRDSGSLWEIVDFIFEGDICVSSTLRELMEHEIRKRDYKGTLNPLANVAKILKFPMKIV